MRLTPARTGAGLMALIGLIHLVLAPEYLEEATYVGGLFIAGAIASFLIAARLWTRESLADWSLAALIAAGMATGFVLSRTVGLPGFQESEWELSGLLSLLAEAGVVVLAFSWMRREPLGPSTSS